MDKKEEKIAIFIPAYNVAHTLPMVIDRIPKSIKKKVKEILIIDNNSQDNTHIVAVQYKKRSGLSKLKIIKNDCNVGYGGNQKIAYNYAIKKGFDYIVLLHGDAQYAPEFIPILLNGIEKDKADMIFGSRMKGNPRKGRMPIYKIIGNRILTKIENFVLKINLSEFHSGFRIYKVDALKKIPFSKCSDGYVFDTDILIQFRVNGLKIIERTIPTHYGEESRHPSNMDIIKYSFNILRAMFSYFLHIKKIKRNEKYEIYNS